MKQLGQLLFILIAGLGCITPVTGYGSESLPDQPILVIGLSSVLPISKVLSNHEEPLLLQIKDINGIQVYSKVIFNTTDHIELTDHTDYLTNGQKYVLEIMSLKTEMILYSGEYFSYWPECEPVKNPYAQFSAGKLSISWNYQDGDNVNHYIVKITDAVGNVLGNFITEPGVSSILLDDSKELVDNNIYVQRVCNYSNGITLHSEWILVSGESDDGFRVDCNDVQNYTFSVSTGGITETTITVNVDPAPGPGVFYKTYYKVHGTESWEYMYFPTNSTSITLVDLTPSTKYNIVVYVTIGANQHNAQSCELLQTIQDHTTLGPSAWLDVYCGADTTFQADSNNDPISPDSIIVGTIIIAGGFPLLIDEVTNVGNNQYSGFAEVKLPFNGKMLRVEFNEVFVNINRVIKSGEIHAVRNEERKSRLNQFLQQQPPGEFSCEPAPMDPEEFDPETGLNPYGFDQEGKYNREPPYPGYEEGDPFDENYDPNGFDAEGNHKDTGTPFDENGCNQAGLNGNGYPCEPWPANPPYYWLNNPGETEEGKAFWNENLEDINDAIKIAINEIYIYFLEEISLKRDTCDGIRDLMEIIVDEKNLDDNFLFGDELQYFEEGMYKNFTSPPLKFSNFSGRDEQIIDLEKHHFDLYGCDKTLDVYKRIIEKINEYKITPEAEPVFELNSASYEAFRVYLEPLIKSMKQTKIDEKLNPNDALEKWVQDELYLLIVNELLEEIDEFGSIIHDDNSIFNEGIFKPNYYEEIVPSWNYGFNGVGCSAPIMYGDVDLDKAQSLLDKFITGDKIKRQDANITKILNNQLTTFFSGNEELGQPIELTKTILGQALTIFLDSIRIIPMQGDAILDAYFILEVQSGKRIVFSVRNISFNRGGISGSIKMGLENDVTFSIGKGMRLHLLGGVEPTYVVWSCGGLDSIIVNAELEFCREYVVPLDVATLEPLEDGYVAASISIAMTGWSDFLIGIDVTPFAITGREEYKFELSNIWFDLSDHNNPPNIQHPENYSHPLKDVPIWNGVYIEDLSITFPSFISGDNNPDKKVSIHNFIFDNNGVSGSFALGELLSLENGAIGGWAFSVDTFNMAINQNRFSKGLMEGLIHVPLLRKKDNNGSIQANDCFIYTANIDSEGKFLFTVVTQSELVVPMYYADLTLTKNTSINITNVNGEFEVTAALHGTLDIQFSEDGIDFSPGIISFEKVILCNRGKAIRDIGIWTFPEVQIGLLGFEINFRKIGIHESKEDPDKVELYFETFLALTTDTAGLKVEFDFGLQGILESNGNHVMWDYDKFIFHRASISGSGLGIEHIEGELIVFRNDNDYGSGWRGNVNVKFKDIDFQVGAVALFGRQQVENNEPFKYFMVDVMVIFPAPVAIFPPVNLDGIGGGFWYNMASLNHNDVSIENAEVPTNAELETKELGYSLSGVAYEPSTGSIGLKLAAAFSIANPKAINGNVALSFTFNKTFGVDEFRFDGSIRVMGDPEIGTPPVQGSGDPGNTAPIRAYFAMTFDFKNTTFKSDFEAYLNVANVLVGAADGLESTNNRFGKVDIFFSEKEWYLWFGTPAEPLAIRLDISGNELARIKTYLVIGNVLPPPPVLNPNLAAFFGVSPNFVLDHRMTTGGGFMHGAQITIGDNYKFWIFTLNALFEVGYDMVVMRYDALCKHNQEKPGFDGWYAQGQMYAYLHVGLGYEVRVFGVKKKGTIADLKAGMLLRASLPNPVYAQGVVAINYNILGAIKGSKRYTLKVGTRCDLVDEEGEEYNMEFELIEGITPDNGTENVPCNQEVVINMNFANKSTLEIGDDTWTFSLDRYTFKDIELNRSVGIFPVQWSDDNLSLSLKPTTYLLPNRTYQVIAYASATKVGGSTERDTAIATILTGGCPQVIETDNISESYPHAGQHHFFIEEIDAEHGYVKLESGQYYLFSQVPPNAQDVVRVKLMESEEVVFEGPLNYNCSKQQLDFEIPWKDFAQPSTSYTIEIVRALKPEVEEEEDPGEGEGDEGFPPLGLKQSEGEESTRFIGAPHLQ